MDGWTDSETLWLTITNVVIAISVLLCLLGVLLGIGRELRIRAKRRRRPPIPFVRR